MDLKKDYEDNRNIMHIKLNKGYKKVAMIWVLSGLCMFLSASINLVNRKSIMSIALSYIASILIFINAYINYKKSKEYKHK